MKILNKVKIPENKKIFFVGDIHGRYDELMNKLKDIKFNMDEDILISVGDLVDRGPKIKEVIELFNQQDNFYCVIGNHDNFLLNFDTEPEKWFDDKRNGSDDTVFQLGKNQLKRYKKILLKKMSLILEIEYGNMKIGVIHGGVPFDNNKPQEWNKIIRKAKRNKRYRANLMWDRTVIRKIWANDIADIPEVQGIDIMVHGHTTIDKPLFFNNRVWIDTFGKTGKLTFLRIENKENIFIQK